MSMTETQIQEELSVAYCHAVISKAGYTIATKKVDYGIDMFVSGVIQYENEFHDAGVLLALQLKATKNAKIIGANVHYRLEMKALNRLKSRCAQPKILVVYTMPRTIDTWVNCARDHMRMENCAYFIKAEDLPAPSDAKNITVRIPTTNLFDATAVQTLAESLSPLYGTD